MHLKIAGRARLALAALAALVVACALVACGSSKGANESVGALLSQTFGKHQSVHSGRIALTVNLNLTGIARLNGPISIRLDGPFQGHGGQALPDFNLGLLFASPAQNLNLGIVSTQGKAWLQAAGTYYTVPDALLSAFKNSYLQAQRSAAKQNGNTFAAFGIDPRQWLTGAHKAGTATVGGAEAVHIAAGVNVTRFLADVNKLLAKAGQLGLSGVASAPGSISPATQAALASGVRSASVDIWTGNSDRILRRLTIAVSLSVPPAKRAAIGGLSGGTIGFDLLLSNLNQAQQISAPASAQPLPSNLLGGTGGSSSGSGGGSSGASSSGSGGVSAPQSYLTCVQRAGGDIAKLQRCASLLNG